MIVNRRACEMALALGPRASRPLLLYLSALCV